MNAKLRAVACLTGFLLFVMAAYASYTSWSGRVEWSTASKQFSVWDSSVGGAEIASPYTDSLGVVSTGVQTFSFYVQNDGNVAITVDVVEGTYSGCTPSWSSTSLSISVGSARTLVTLTLDIAADGSYDWDFVVA